MKLLKNSFIVLFIATLCFAEVPRTMNYQGKLTDASDIAVVDADRLIAFNLYDVSTGGTPIWAETLSVSIVHGLFDVILGETHGIDLPFDNQYYIELVIDETDDGVIDATDDPLLPRQPFSSNAYSFRSVYADTAGFVLGGGDQDLASVYEQGGNVVRMKDTDGDVIFFNDEIDPDTLLFIDEDGPGFVGIGMTEPQTVLDIRGGIGLWGEDFALGSDIGGMIYRAAEGGSYHQRYFLRFDLTDDASYPYLTNRTPNGAVVIKTGASVAGSENEHFRIEGGDGVVDAYFTNARLGIGTDSPQQRLHVVGPDSGIRVQYPGDATYVDIVSGTDGGSIRVNNPTSGYGLSFKMDDSIEMMLRNDGHLGIDQSNPRTRVHLGSETESPENMILFGEAENATQSYEPRIHQISRIDPGASEDLAIGAASGGGGVLFYTGVPADRYAMLGTGSSVPRMAILSNGNIGVGTISPTHKFEINGDLFVGNVPHDATADSVLTIDGGVVKRVAVSDIGGSTSPGGTNGAIQFNNSGVFGGDASLLFWDEIDGQLGIGTNSPESRLDITNTAGVTLALRTTGISSSTAILRICGARPTGADAAVSHIRFENNETGSPVNTASIAMFNSDEVAGTPNSDLVFMTHDGTDNTEKLRILDNGNVGIGTSTPGEDLELHCSSSATSAGLWISNDTDVQTRYYTIRSASSASTQNKTHIYNSGGYDIVLQEPGGNVGIGTWTPGYRLEVSGTGHFTGELSLGTVADDATADSVLTIDGGVVKRVATSSIGGDDDDWAGAGTGQMYAATITDSIGIGTINPLLKLDIRGSNGKTTTAALENLFQIASNDASNPLSFRFGIKTDATAANRYGHIEVDDNGTKRDIIISPNGGNGGNVGIGITTATPGARLDVLYNGSSTNYAARIRNATNATSQHGLLVSTATSATNLSYILNAASSGGSTSRFYVRSDGNVGIGTTAPSTQLHTTGGVRFAGLSGSGPHLEIDSDGNITRTTISDNGATKAESTNIKLYRNY